MDMSPRSLRCSQSLLATRRSSPKRRPRAPRGRRTFGFAIGVFVFSVTTALVIGDDPKGSVIVPTVEVVAVLTALAMIRSLQVKAFAAIQLAPTLSAIAARGHGILTDLYLRPGRQTGSPPPRCRPSTTSSPDPPATTPPWPAASLARRA